MFSIARWYTVQTHNTILCLFVYCFRGAVKKRRVEHKTWCASTCLNWAKKQSSIDSSWYHWCGPSQSQCQVKIYPESWWSLVGEQPLFYPTWNPTMPSTTLWIYVILCNNPGTNQCMDAMPVSGYLMKTEHPTLKNHMKQRWRPWKDIRGPKICLKPRCIQAPIVTIATALWWWNLF